MLKTFVVATFSDSESLLEAVRAVRRENFRIYDVYTPFPMHELEHEMNIRRTRLPRVTLIMCACGLLSAFVLQFYTAVLDWPLNVGGKPDNSTLAFVPIMFELTVLIGGLSTVAAFFLRTKLFPGKREDLMAEGITNDSFALVLRKREFFDTGRAFKVLQNSGALGIEERTAAI